MVSGPRKIALLAAAAALSACATPVPWSTASFFQGPPEADIYADYLAARYAGMVGDPVEAAVYYRRAYEREPTAQSLETATFAALMAADMAGAAKVARSADGSKDHTSQTAELVRAIDDIAQGRGERALKRLETRSLGVMNAEMAAYLRAWLEASVSKDVDRAVAALDTPLSRRSSRAEAACLQGLTLLHAGRAEEALQKLTPCTAASAPEPIVALHAQLLAARGDQAGARELLARTPSGGVRSALVARVNAGSPVEAPVIDMREGAALAVLLASSSGLARSSPQIMTIRMTMALHLDPDLDAARMLLADALGEQGRPADALKLVAQAQGGSAYQPDFKLMTARLNLALGEADKSNIDKAYAAASEAAAMSARRDVRLAVADIMVATGRLPEAEALLGQVIRADARDGSGEGDWRALFARASVRQQLGRWEDAEADAMAALALEPNRPDLLNFIGYAWVDRGENIREGLDLIRRAVAASPGQGYIIDSLGWAHYRLGEYDEAVEYLEQAAGLAPNSPEILEHLGDAYWRLGRTVEAGYEWRAALALTTEAEASEALRRKIAHGLDAGSKQALAAGPAGTP